MSLVNVTDTHSCTASRVHSFTELKRSHTNNDANVPVCQGVGGFIYKSACESVYIALHKITHSLYFRVDNIINNTSMSESLAPLTGYHRCNALSLTGVVYD